MMERNNGQVDLGRWVPAENDMGTDRKETGENQSRNPDSVETVLLVQTQILQAEYGFGDLASEGR